MIKKIILAALCLSLCVVCSPEITYGFEAINELNRQLLEKYPNIETVKKQFGAEARWHEKIVPSPHDPNLDLVITYMEHPSIEIRTMGYTNEDGDRFFMLLTAVKEAGIVKFLGIDIGSTWQDVKNKFGEPQAIEGNKLVYEDEAGFYIVNFIIQNNVVAEMNFNSYPD